MERTVAMGIELAVGSGLGPAGIQSRERLWTKDFTLVCLISFGTFMCMQMLMPTLPLYVKGLGGQDSDVGLILGIYSVAAVAARAFTGPVVATWGKRRLIIAGALFYVVSVAVYNLAATVPSVLLVRLFHGLAFGVATTACGVLAADLAPAPRRAEALGYFSNFGSIGTAVGPGIGLWLIAVQGLPMEGFSFLFTTASIIATMAFVLTFVIGKSSLTLDGQTPTELEGETSGFFCWPAAPFAATMLFVSFAVGALFVFVPVYISSEGTGNVSAFFFVYALFMVTSRPLAGAIADRFDRRAVVIPMMVIFAGGVGLLAFSPSLPVVVASAVVCGVGFGSVQPTLLALIVDSVKPHERGPAMGMFISSIDIGIGVGSTLLGLVAQAVGYPALFMISAGVVAVGLVQFLIYQRSVPGRKAAQPPAG